MNKIKKKNGRYDCTTEKTTDWDDKGNAKKWRRDLVETINKVADEIGIAAMLLGAGRATKEDEIDLAVGLMLRKKVGDAVKEGEPFVTIYANRENVEDVKAKIYENISIAETAEAPKLVHTVITD